MRLSFLARFALITFLAAVLAAAALATVLIGHHRASVEADEGISAAGQVAQLLSTPLDGVPSAGAPDAATVDGLDGANEAAKRLQFVMGIRIFRSDGSQVYPETHAPTDRDAIGDVRTTIARDTLWSRDAADPNNRDALVQYMPYATASSTFVVAIDLSHHLLSGAERGEVKTIVLATAGALALVFVSLVALAAGASRELETRRRQAQETFVKTLTLLAAAIDRRDPYTAGHSARVAEYSRKLAIELRLSRRKVDVVEHAALLHDLGKIGIPDSVLLKPGKLDAHERDVIERHPVIGGELLSGVSTMEDIAPCVLHHHERIDGRGYPGKLSGSDIPLGARLIAVADTFDAMTTDRPYRRALSSATALNEMRRVSGTQLETEFVEAFARLVDRGEIVPPKPAEMGESLDDRFGPRHSQAGAA
jgi:HD-GYP domain-containing protein (c-di-GMP phosphodiesterase class II)